MIFSDDDAGFEAFATSEDIHYCFRLLLGRNPSRREWLGHSARIGEPLDNVVPTYLNSLEFSRRGLLRPPADSFQLVALDGFNLYVNPNDVAVSREILATSWYEPHVSNVFRRSVFRGARVVDVGANIGFYSLLASSLAGPDGHVWAVEPNPQNVRMILASIAQNRCGNVTVIQAAAADKWQTMGLFRDGSNGTVAPFQADNPATTPDTVLALPLDACLSDRVDILKIDVEGAEGRAVRGMAGAIQRSHPIIFTELTPGALPGMSGMTADEYLGLLLDFGYSLTVLNDPALECGRSIAKVMHRYGESGRANLDILAQA